MTLQEHDTWSVIDSSKIQEYMSCARSYFFKYMLGWQQERPNIHLEFGSAIHLAMEYMLTNGEDLPRKVNYTAETILGAYNLFEEYYRNVFPESDDDANSPKIPSNVLLGLPQYAKKYRHDNFTVLYTEVAGAVMVDKDRTLYVLIDSICKDEYGVFSLENKTTKSITSSWCNQWKQKLQVGAYTHVLHCMFPDEEVAGVTINALSFHDPPKRKANGELYANAKDNEFMRVNIRKTNEKMEDWLNTVNIWMRSIEQSIGLLSHDSDSNIVMRSFPKNTESCTKYFGCPYIDYCDAWPNPLQHINSLPAGYTCRFWDPRKKMDNIINL